MKKYVTFLLLLFIFVPFTPIYGQEEEGEETEVIQQEETALGEENEEGEEEEVADPTKPLYFFTTVLEEIEIFFTFDDDKRIEKRLEFAEKRVAEMALMAEQGNEAELDKIQARYERQIEQALKIANKHSEMAQEKVERIEQSREKHLLTLEKVSQQVPEQAKPSIDKVIEKTKVRYTIDKEENKALKDTGKPDDIETGKPDKDSDDDIEGEVEIED
jgi:hypothetical protein